MFKTLPGFREFYPDDCAKRNFIFSKWRKTAETFGFREFDPPVLEQVELFTEKSGEEIKSQLFEFVDKGGRGVSLRPEMTPSLARMVGAKAPEAEFFHIGEVFSYCLFIDVTVYPPPITPWPRLFRRSLECRLIQGLF